MFLNTVWPVSSGPGADGSQDGEDDEKVNGKGNT
jgi:hypothetical protein